MAKKKTEEKHDVGAETLSMTLESLSKKHDVALKWLKDVQVSNLDLVSTGSISLDYALSGGMARGRMVEIYGWEGTGKSTLAMNVLANETKKGRKCLYVDAERALDPRLPVSYGVDPTNFILEDAPITAEKHFEILEDIISSGGISACVVDSVSALLPELDSEGNVGDVHVGTVARFLSSECRKLVQLIGETNTLVIFINQFREKIMRVPGDNRTTSGGHALRFYTTHRIEVSGTGKTQSGQLRDEDGEVIGHRMMFKVVKNKIGIPFRSGEIDLIYGKGYDTVGELVDVGESFGIINKGGAWYSYEDHKGQGREGFKRLLLENEKLRGELEEKIRRALKLPLVGEYR